RHLEPGARLPVRVLRVGAFHLRAAHRTVADGDADRRPRSRPRVPRAHAPSERGHVVAAGGLDDRRGRRVPAAAASPGRGSRTARAARRAAAGGRPADHARRRRVARTELRIDRGRPRHQDERRVSGRPPSAVRGLPARLPRLPGRVPESLELRDHRRHGGRPQLAGARGGTLPRPRRGVSGLPGTRPMALPAVHLLGREPAERLRRALLVALLLAGVLVFATIDRADPDLWGHVRYGQDVLASGHLPATATYTYTATSQRWINHENLSEIVFAFVADHAGGTGLAVLKTLLALGLLALM